MTARWRDEADYSNQARATCGWVLKLTDALLAAAGDSDREIMQELRAEIAEARAEAKAARERAEAAEALARDLAAEHQRTARQIADLDKRRGLFSNGKSRRSP
jgi:chromosome segregation ATPase